MTNSMCFNCMKEAGYSGRDNGAHTAMTKECSGCGKVKAILPMRHWVKWPDETRIDSIGQNGNDGDHYSND